MNCTPCRNMLCNKVGWGECNEPQNGSLRWGSRTITPTYVGAGFKPALLAGAPSMGALLRV